MTVDEAARLHLYEQARESWDDTAAETLMRGLPWDQDRLATKELLKAELENTENRLNSRADRRLMGLALSIVTMNIAMVTVLIAVLQGGR